MPKATTSGGKTREEELEKKEGGGHCIDSYLAMYLSNVAEGFTSGGLAIKRGETNVDRD